MYNKNVKKGGKNLALVIAKCESMCGMLHNVNQWCGKKKEKERE